MINFSELLWTSRLKKDQSSPTVEFPQSRNEDISALRHTPIERAKVDTNGRTALLLDSKSPAADRLRYVRMRLRELRTLAKLQSVVITSPLPGDGKSTITMCLATALAEDRQCSVLVVEADLRRPSLAKSLGLMRRAGLAECLEAGLDPRSELRRVEPTNWYLLQAGESQSNPTELLQSDAFPALINKVSPYFDWVVVDAPPALPLTDAPSLSRSLDATLVVARANRTPRAALEESLSLIGRKQV